MRVTLDPAFDFELPEGWTAEIDEEGGVAVTGHDGVGLLHLIAFEQDEDEELDPAEELYIFLEDQGIELEEDEIEDLALPSGAALSLCEYLSEGEDEEDEDPGAAETTYWLVAVATIPGNLVFCSYTCPAGFEEVEREAVHSLLTTLRLSPPGR
ncbi:MAG TPA: hypothetical protein VF167_00995 [Longimicrobiaceae bacterium]